MSSEAVALEERVSVLFVDSKGPYPELVRDWYDETRDARMYAGPNPIVAHPPCGPWSSLRTLSNEPTKDCGPIAVDLVRRFGGVLEHPCGSKLFAHCGMPRPGQLADAWGGLTWEVEQVDWGHVARKRSWLYVVGARAAMPPAPPKRKPTHWCSGGGKGRGKTPPGIKVCSEQQRRRTPVDFARFLIDIARTCVPPISEGK